MSRISSQIFFSVFLTLFFGTIVQAQDYNLPSNFYEASCVLKSEKFELSIAEKYRSDKKNVGAYYHAVVGDLDGDDFGEIVIPSGNTPEVFIFNHKAELIRTIALPLGASTPNYIYDSVVLCDLDNDGEGEIIVTGNNIKTLFVFSHKGVLLDKTTISTNFPKAIGVADFNNDGLPEIYVGNNIYAFENKKLVLLVNGGDTSNPTVAQDINKDGIPELISIDTSYEVNITNRYGENGNSITRLSKCDAIKQVGVTLRSFALADVNLDNSIDVVSLVPIDGRPSKIEVRVWNPQTGAVILSEDVMCNGTGATRNSWPFIGDADGNGYPDIVFMGGLNGANNTCIYRVEYDAVSNQLVERVRNCAYIDYSSRCTSMSMFDFNNDGKQEIVYRDETALYIINGSTLQPEKTEPNCFSGTGWEYPVVASLTPSGESSIIMCSGESKTNIGTLRIYGADTQKGNKPWIPARKVWNQFAFYQNTINDNLKIIANPAPLDVKLTSKDGMKTLQPFNGYMLQLGVINPLTLESVYPVADIGIDIANTTYGLNRVENQLRIDFKVRNTGDAPMDPNIAIEVFKVANGVSEVIYTDCMTDTFNPGDQHSINISINNFLEHYPFDYLEVHVAKDKYDCNTLNNKLTILPEEIGGVLYVKKGSSGKGLTWADAMGELSDALAKAEIYNIRDPYSLTQIWIAEGTYSSNFVMQEGVNIYGGFRGEETEIEESRPLQFPTILDAQDLGRPLTQLSDYAIETEWRGLTLLNGNTQENGAGALLRKGSTLSYSVIKNNTSTNGQGGGIYANNSRIINCIVEQNTSITNGAGIYAINNSTAINNTIVKNNILNDNKTATITAQGAGLYADASTVVNNIIYKNTSNSQTDNIFATQGSIINNNLANNDDSVDPLFINFESGDYNLLPISPALNIGDNSATKGHKSDIVGKDRIYENDIVDIGAFEHQGIKLALSIEGYFYVNNAKAGNGADWTNAAKELSDAVVAAKLINAAKPNTVRRIWVAAGTYKGAFEMVEGADVHGGFAGNETNFNQMDTVANKTYIDAQCLGRVLTQSQDFDIPTEWAGLILQNGYATAIDHDVYGGGAYLKKNGTIRYSTVKNSHAQAISIHNKVNAYGGGVYMEEGANLANSIIDNNVATVMLDSPTGIEYGVAQGGGVNNVKNRLAYLIVRNNKTSSENNTDGGAIYSTGNVINSIINSNEGKSAIYLSSNQTVVNSTIADNTVEYTIVGNWGSKIQNSIVYNNAATVGNFSQVEYETLNNLYNANPEFETGSYKLKITSPARTKGNTSYFPTDLNIDMEGNLRYISLKNNVKVIDAGAYQSNIKVVAATATKIEVPFGTKFEDVGLLDQLEGLLESEYAFDCDIAWLKGVYNEFGSGDYKLYGDLSNLPAGVINPDEVKGIIIVTIRENHISDIEGLTINGENWLPNLEMQYTIDCDNELNSIPITMTLPYFATVKFQPEIEFEQEGNETIAELNIPRAGNHSLTAIVTSQDGENTTTYPLTIVKNFPFWSIIEQRWNNTFVINNNKETNGGYEFVSYKWYKNNAEIGTMQYYSAGDKRTDLLDEGSLYYAEMIDKDGVKYTTCKANAVLMNSVIKVYPNPVKIGETITIEIPRESNKGATVNIYSLSGLSAKQIDLSAEQSTIQAPSLPGMYILKVSINGGVSESIRMIVY